MKTNFLFFMAGAVLAILSSCGGAAKVTPQADADSMNVNVNEKMKDYKIYSISMNKICKEWDGQWQGMTVASDGNCYFSSSTHSKSHGAGFHKFNPTTYQHTMLTEDMTEVCGESATLSQQGKIHSPIAEDDGWLYFCTHLSNYWKEGIENYTGAHVLGYEMATGKFKDYGIVRPRYSIYSALGIDPQRRKIYVFVVPFLPELYESDGCHLYSIDMDSGEKKDLGLVVKGRKAASFWFFIDNKGNVWFTLWKRNYEYENDKGNLYVYRPDQDKIETYVDVLPKGRLIDGTPVDAHNLTQRAWTWLSPFKDRTKCYFSMGTLGGGDEHLWIFDPMKNIENGEAFQEIAAIGSNYFETAVGGDKLYFVQYESLEDARKIFSEDEREIDPSSDKYVDRKLHLRSISLKDGDDHNKITDYGPIIDQDGRAARMIMSMSADDKGHVFVYGSWHVKSFKEATLQYLLFEYPNGDLYRLLKRGEFFAVINTNK
ncbi:MAG: hypothetical protein ACTTKN_07915 [Phocaeicola sp.]|uniref:hypothetical protein n=1 Tax=Phocaeicola TaxID=909656 RepID=UPI00234E88EC|nr:hypothetical protein [Phocaeicola oris]MCE2616328.1 hypothetical protein [Phocaeicola oris]